MNYNELKRRAENAKKNRDAKGMMKWYGLIYEGGESDIWDRYFFALSLRRNGLVDRSLELCRELYSENKLFKPMRDLYALNILDDLRARIGVVAGDELVRGLEAIGRLREADDGEMLRKSFFYLTKDLSEKERWDVLGIVLAGDERGDDCDVRLKKGKSEKYVFPSLCETYYMSKVRLLLGLGRYDEAVSVGEEGLKRVKYFCFSNDVWLRRLVAQSKRKSGDLSGAVGLYFDIFRRKRDWFLEFELGEILLESGNSEAALYYGLSALRDRQKIDFKVRLLRWLIGIEQDKIDKGVLRGLYCVVRLRMRGVRDYVCNEGDFAKSEAELLGILREELNRYGNSLRVEGRVESVFGNGFGFLFAEKKKFFYISRVKDLKKGDEVIGRYSWNYDRKKKRLGECVIVEKRK